MEKEKSLRKIIIDEDCLLGRPLAVDNLSLSLSEADTESRVSNAIDAYVRSEHNTFRYAASSFAPILLLLSTLQFYDEVDDLFTDWLITLIVVFLGFSGFYYACYNMILITFRRILLEGLQLKLIREIEWDIFPRGHWKKLNITAMVSLLLGYAGLFILLLRRLWG